MEFHQYRCFGRSEHSGNTAYVIAGHDGDSTQRQDLTRRLKAPACVFMASSQEDSLQLDYYYPHARSPLCLHATLAACRVYFDHHPQATRVAITASLSGTRFQARHSDGQIYLQLAAQPVSAQAVDPALLETWFGADSQQLVGTPSVASVGSPKLLVQIRDVQALHRLTPRLEAIQHWSQANRVSGCYVWCQTEAGHIAGRNFNHLDPAQEDAATGVAAGALALSLRRDLTLHQGDAQGNPCRIEVRYQPPGIELSGRCERVAAEA